MAPSGRRSVKIVAVILGIIAVSGLLYVAARGRAGLYGAHRECNLHAQAAVASRNTPIGRATNWNTDVLSIRSADSDDWQDLEITISGFAITGTKGKQPTGPYRKKRDSVFAGTLTSVQLNDFENGDGGHWVSLTMTADTVSLKASIRGAACAAEISLNGSQP